MSSLLPVVQTLSSQEENWTKIEAISGIQKFWIICFFFFSIFHGDEAHIFTRVNFHTLSLPHWNQISLWKRNKLFLDIMLNCTDNDLRSESISVGIWNQLTNYILDAINYYTICPSKLEMQLEYSGIIYLRIFWTKWYINKDIWLC